MIPFQRLVDAATSSRVWALGDEADEEFGAGTIEDHLLVCGFVVVVVGVVVVVVGAGFVVFDCFEGGAVCGGWTAAAGTAAAVFVRFAVFGRCCGGGGGGGSAAVVVVLSAIVAAMGAVVFSRAGFVRGVPFGDFDHCCGGGAGWFSLFLLLV